MVEVEVCRLTGKLAIKQCPETKKVKLSKDTHLDSCVYHKTNFDADNLYIHKVMNAHYKKGDCYQISRALKESDFIRNYFKGDYGKLSKLLHKLDNSEQIKLSIRTIDPEPGDDPRDYYGNYQEFFPEEKKSSEIRRELKWLYLNGVLFDAKLKREYCRRYHEKADIIQYYFDSIQKDMTKFSTKELEEWKTVEAFKRNLEKKLNNK